MCFILKNPILNSSFLDFKIINIKNAEKILSDCQGNSASAIFIGFLKEDEAKLDFLTKILSAVKLNLNTDVCYLIKTKENDFSFSTLNVDNRFDKAIFFGIPPQKVGLQINYLKYRLFKISNCQYLFADDLSTIAQNQQKKKLLWQALQVLFK